MARLLKFALVVILALAILIQLVPVERTNPPVEADLGAPAEVASILRAACYDCHSNETRWPWYARVAPVSWLVAKDVREGREALNFSRLGTAAPDRQAHAREEIWEEVAEGEMPLAPYLLTHPGARLTDAQRETLRAWCAAGDAAAMSRAGDTDGDHDD